MKIKAKERTETVPIHRVALGVAIVALFAIAVIYLLVSSFLGSSTRAGGTIYVEAGGDVQAAIDRARPGDTILLQAGAKFRGNFVLRSKRGTEPITIRSSLRDEKLPVAGKRIDPRKFAGMLADLSSPNNTAVVSTEGGASYYRFVAVSFGGTRDGENNIVQIGTGDEESEEEIPQHIEFDRVYMRATSSDGQRRGIAANGRHIVIRDSHISGIRRKGEESQAIAAWATDGPITIENNYLEAAAENILFGGAGSPLKLVPANCVVRDNTLSKPMSWRKEGWLVKNLFEIKNGRDITVSGNLMENNWAMGQDGTAVLFTVREDNGPATVIENITFENNVIRGSGGAVSIYGSEGSGGRNLIIRNNLFADIDKKKWGGSGQFLKISDWDGVTIENNTVLNSGNITTAYGKPVRRFVFRNNIVFNNEYGLIGDDASPGRETLDRYFPNARFSNNLIVGGSSRFYGSRNFYVSSIGGIGFADRNSYRLASSSRFASKASDGGEIGYRGITPGTKQ